MRRGCWLVLLVACTEEAGALDPRSGLDAAPTEVGPSDRGPSYDSAFDAGADVGFDQDAAFVWDAQVLDAFVPDATSPAECTTAADCTQAPFGSVGTCPNSAWSCVAGSCVWECMGGRTCSPAIPNPGSSCLSCDFGVPQCAGERCRHDLSSPILEDATCARDFLRSPGTCFGDFLELEDGTLCTLLELPTGAPRSVLACGPCQTQFIW
jgi:hypothetical protein